MRKYLQGVFLVWLWPALAWGLFLPLCLMDAFADTGVAGAQPAMPNLTFTIKSFTVEGDNPFGDGRTQAILAPFTGEHDSLQGIQDAAKVLEEAFLNQGYAFHKVTVPPQRTRGGDFKLKVLAFKLERILIEGNEHFDTENILASLPGLYKGASLNSRETARSLLLANEHPSKRVAVFMQESDAPDAIDARIKVRDARPWQAFASLANTGTSGTGDGRLSLGFQHANLFNRDHALTLSYTTAPGHYAAVKQRGAFYRLPLYSSNSMLSAFWVSSDVEQGDVGTGDFVFDVGGSGVFKGVQLDYIPLPKGKYSDRLGFSLEDKLFETRIGNIGNSVRSRPIGLHYTGRWETESWQGGFQLEYFRNLVKGRHNNREMYKGASNNGRADPHWEALRFGGDFNYMMLNGWQFRTRLEGQHGLEPLIPGEGFSLGGANSVRGFEEGEESGDSGYTLNLEFYSPTFETGVQLLGFIDYGYRHIRETTFGQENNDSLASFGVGLRWRWRENFSLSLDLARVINGTQETEVGEGKVHLNALVRF